MTVTHGLCAANAAGKFSRLIQFYGLFLMLANFPCFIYSGNVANKDAVALPCVNMTGHKM